MNRMVLLLCAVGLMLGCMPEFDEEWLVKDLRTLGIRSRPYQTQLSHLSLQQFSVDALVVDPTSPPDRAYDWELWICPVSFGLCDDAERRLLLHRGHTPLDQITVQFYMDRQVVRWGNEFMAQSQGTLAELTLELRVYQSPGPTLRGVKELQLRGPNWPSSSEGNPWLWVEVDNQPLTGPIHVASCTTLSVSADSSDGSSDLSWYLSQGQASLGSGYTGYWDPCGDADTAHLWLVLRNGIGGIDWEEVQVLFGP